MSQIECKLARTWSNWGFLRWCHIGCCACANLKLTENFRESGACCKRLRNVAWQKNSLWSGLTASGSCIRLAQDLCCMFDTQTVFVRPSHPHGCVNWNTLEINYFRFDNRRTHTGAWIETLNEQAQGDAGLVAPTRVRELKLQQPYNNINLIESHPHGCVNWNQQTDTSPKLFLSRTHTGAWIEVFMYVWHI